MSEYRDLLDVDGGTGDAYFNSKEFAMRLELEDRHFWALHRRRVWGGPQCLRRTVRSCQEVSLNIFFKDYDYLIRQCQVVQEKKSEVILKIIKGSRFAESGFFGVMDQLREFLGDENPCRCSIC